VVVEREHLLSLFDPDSGDNDDEPLVFLGLLVLRYMQAGDTILNTNGSSAETACVKVDEDWFEHHKGKRKGSKGHGRSFIIFHGGGCR
jgi:hypothetical protein